MARVVCLISPCTPLYGFLPTRQPGSGGRFSRTNARAERFGLLRARLNQVLHDLGWGRLLGEWRRGVHPDEANLLHLLLVAQEM